ncbi:MAG: hypothetical protein ACXWKP_23935 [Bradyrhizobium sp.]
MPANLSMRPGTRDIPAFTLLLLAGSPAVAEPVRYELFPEPDVGQTATNRTCVKLPLDIGRPTLTESYDAQAVTGTTSVSAFLPVIWFIEPATGAIQFCAVRHAGACVGLTLP